MASPSAFPATGSFLAQPSGMAYGGMGGMGGMGGFGYAGYMPSYTSSMDTSSYMRPWMMAGGDDEEDAKSDDGYAPGPSPTKSKYKPLSSARTSRSVVQKQRSKARGKK